MRYVKNFESHKDLNIENRELILSKMDKMIPHPKEVYQNIFDLFYKCEDDDIHFSIDLVINSGSEYLYVYHFDIDQSSEYDDDYFKELINEKLKSGLKLYYQITFDLNIHRKFPNWYINIPKSDNDPKVQYQYKLLQEHITEIWMRLNSMYRIKIIKSEFFDHIIDQWVDLDNKFIMSNQSTALTWILEIN